MNTKTRLILVALLVGGLVLSLGSNMTFPDLGPIGPPPAGLDNETFSLSHTLSDTTDYVDSAASDVDSHADHGTESSFAAEQSAPDSTYDTLTEAATTTPAQVAFVAAGTGAAGTTTTITPGMPTGETTGYLYLAQIMVLGTTVGVTSLACAGDISFALLSGPHTMGTVARVWIYYAYSDNGVEPAIATLTTGAGTVGRFCRVYMFSNVHLTIGSAYEAVNWVDEGSVSTVLDRGVTTTGTLELALNFVNIREDTNTYSSFAGETGGDWLEAVAEYANGAGDDGCLQLQRATMASAATVDGGSYAMGASDPVGAVGLALKPKTYNYELDLERQWTSADYDESNEYVCVKTGTLGETLKLEVRNGASWVSLDASLDAASWNNYSVASYLTSNTITFRFLGGTETGDTTQNTFQIDSMCLRTWTTNTAPTNDIAPACTNLDDTDYLYGRYKLYTFTTSAQDTDGYGDLDYVDLSCIDGAGAVQWTIRYDEDTDSFSETAGASYIALDGTSAATRSGANCDGSIKVYIELGHPDVSDYDLKQVVADEHSATDTDSYTALNYNYETRVDVSSYDIADAGPGTARGNIDGSLTASGTAIYYGSALNPPSAEFDVWVSCADVTGSPWSDLTLTAGAFSATVAADDAIGQDTYTLSIVAEAAGSGGTNQLHAAHTDTYIADQITVKSTTANMTHQDINDNVEVRATAWREYDDSYLGSGDTVTLNGVAMTWDVGNSWFDLARTKATVGSWSYYVNSTADATYGTTSLNVDGKAISIIFDEIDITGIYANLTELTAGETVLLNVTMVYDYNNAAVAAGTFSLEALSLDWNSTSGAWEVTDTSASPTTRTYDLVTGSGSVYDIHTVNMNGYTVTVEWVAAANQVNITLTISYGWTVVSYNITIHWSAIYSPSGDPFEGSVTLNTTAGTFYPTYTTTGLRAFTVTAINDSLYELETFVCNVVSCTWDNIASSSVSWTWQQADLSDIWLVLNTGTFYWVENDTDIGSGLPVRSYVNGTAKDYDYSDANSQIANLWIGTFDATWYYGAFQLNVTDIELGDRTFVCLVWSKVLEIQIEHSIHIASFAAYEYDDGIWFAVFTIWGNASWSIWDNDTLIAYIEAEGTYYLEKGSQWTYHNLTILVNATDVGGNEAEQTKDFSSSDYWLWINYHYGEAGQLYYAVCLEMEKAWMSGIWYWDMPQLEIGGYLMVWGSLVDNIDTVYLYADSDVLGINGAITLPTGVRANLNLTEILFFKLNGQLIYALGGYGYWGEGWSLRFHAIYDNREAQPLEGESPQELFGYSYQLAEYNTYPHVYDWGAGAGTLSPTGFTRIKLNECERIDSDTLWFYGAYYTLQFEGDTTVFRVNTTEYVMYRWPYYSFLFRVEDEENRFVCYAVGTMGYTSTAPNDYGKLILELQEMDFSFWDEPHTLTFINLFGFGLLPNSTEQGNEDYGFVYVYAVSYLYDPGQLDIPVPSIIQEESYIQMFSTVNQACSYYVYEDDLFTASGSIGQAGPFNVRWLRQSGSGDVNYGVLFNSTSDSLWWNGTYSRAVSVTFGVSQWWTRLVLNDIQNYVEIFVLTTFENATVQVYDNDTLMLTATETEGGLNTMFWMPSGAGLHNITLNMTSGGTTLTRFRPYTIPDWTSTGLVFVYEVMTYDDCYTMFQLRSNWGNATWSIYLNGSLVGSSGSDPSNLNVTRPSDYGVYNLTIVCDGGATVSTISNIRYSVSPTGTTIYEGDSASHYEEGDTIETQIVTQIINENPPGIYITSDMVLVLGLSSITVAITIALVFRYRKAIEQYHALGGQH